MTNYRGGQAATNRLRTSPAAMYSSLCLGFAKAVQTECRSPHASTLQQEPLFLGKWGRRSRSAFLFSLSGTLETYAIYRTNRAIESIMKLRPRVASKVNPLARG